MKRYLVGCMHEREVVHFFAESLMFPGKVREPQPLCWSGRRKPRSERVVLVQAEVTCKRCREMVYGEGARAKKGDKYE